jgi:hypothetical protein
MIIIILIGAQLNTTRPTLSQPECNTRRIGSHSGFVLKEPLVSYNTQCVILFFWVVAFVINGYWESINMVLASTTAVRSWQAV